MVKDTAGSLNALAHDGTSERLKQNWLKYQKAELQSCVDDFILICSIKKKYLPNGIEMRLRLNRYSTNFCLTGKAGSPAPTVVFETVSFNVRNVEILPVIANDFNQVIAQQNMKIPIRREEVKTFTVGTGLQSKVEDHLFQGQLPKRIFIGMVRNDAFNGAYAQHPFCVLHVNLCKLNVSCNGHRIHNRPFELDFDNGLYLKSYLSLHQAVSVIGANKSFDIT